MKRKSKTHKSLVECKLTRRKFIYSGSGSLLALPTALTTLSSESLKADCQTDAPCRLVTFYFPNGCAPEFWNYTSALSPLTALRPKIAVLRGIVNSVSENNGEDEHAQGSCNLFTGRALSGSAAAESTLIQGDSLDQFASRTLDQNTALGQPLVAGVWRGFAGGVNRPSHWYRRSWRINETTGVSFGVTPTSNPSDIFSRIFGANTGLDQTRLNATQKSILDAVAKEYRSLVGDNSPFGAESKRQLESHLETVRDLELSIDRFQQPEIIACRNETPTPPNLGSGLLSYSQFQRAFELQIDLLVVALSCGITNTGSLMFASAGEEYLNTAISANITDHASSHYASGGHDLATARTAFIAYRRQHMSNLARLLSNMNSIIEQNGRSLLDNSIVVAGSEFGDSKTVHVRSPQPHLVAGGVSRLRLNQELDVDSKHTPNDLYKEILRALNINVQTFGDPGHHLGEFSAIRL